ncbi:MAG: DNA repair protein RecO [Gemmatimonadetes bacterium]|nr:DNA repair protein RecO [Gemmatimonadota bacterium]
MRHIATDALVLHLFDYRETSRIVRLVTRDAGVVSVVARGARRPRNQFGAALDLFASGVAHIRMHPTRDLHALNGFEAAGSRPELGESLDRFAAASVISELCLRFGRESETGSLYATAIESLDAVVMAAPDRAVAAGLASAWRLVAEFGFAPALDQCAVCHGALAGEVMFHHRAGGALCESCARQARGGRRLPAEARATLGSWIAGSDIDVDSASVRAHMRLLREFLEEHLSDGRPLRAFAAWEQRQGGRSMAEAAP